MNFVFVPVKQVKNDFFIKTIIFAAVFLTNTMVALEAYGFAICDMILQGYFAIDHNRRTWILGAFLLGMAAPNPIFNTFRSHMTDKLLFMRALVCFGCLSACSVFVTNYYIFLFLRFFMGFSGSLIVNMSIILFNKISAERYKDGVRAFGSFVFLFNLGLASIIGGFISQNYYWRWIFALEVGLSIACFVSFHFFLKEDGIKQKIEKVDKWGYFYFLGLLFSCRVFFSQVKAPWNTLGWRSDFSLFFFLLIMVFFFLLLKQSLKPGSIFKFALFKNQRFILACFVVFMIRSVVFGPQLLLIPLLIEIYSYQYDVTGLVISTFGISIFVSGMISFFIAKYTKIKHVVLMCMGAIMMGIDSFLTHSLTIQSEPTHIAWVLMLKGIGIGQCVYMLVLYIEETVHKEDVEDALKLNQTIGGFVTAISSSVLGAIVTIRETYHSLIFGQQVNVYSAAYKNYIRSFRLFAEDSDSQTHENGIRIAKKYVIDQIQKQSTIASFDDAVFILGLVNLAGVTIILIDIYVIHARKRKAMSLD